MIQSLAAHLSGMDRLVFPMFNRTGSKALSSALQIFEPKLVAGRMQIAVADLLTEIQDLGLEWGVSLVT